MTVKTLEKKVDTLSVTINNIDKDSQYLISILDWQDDILNWLIVKITELEQKLDKILPRDDLDVDKRYKMFKCLDIKQLIELYEYQNKKWDKSYWSDLMKKFDWLWHYEATTFTAFWNTASKKNKEKVLKYLLNN